MMIGCDVTLGICNLCKQHKHPTFQSAEKPTSQTPTARRVMPTNTHKHPVRISISRVLLDTNPRISVDKHKQPVALMSPTQTPKRTSQTPTDVFDLPFDI